MDLRQEIYRKMADNLNRLETEAITQALCKALELDDCNPYDYLNRMTAQFRGGSRYVLLDGEDLMCIRPVKTEYFHEELRCTLETEYLWLGNKKPAV